MSTISDLSRLDVISTAAKNWLRERGWVVERVWRRDLNDHRYAVGHTKHGCFNVYGYGLTVDEAVRDAQIQLRVLCPMMGWHSGADPLHSEAVSRWADIRRRRWMRW